ncbi:hypothetical protein BD626DRAFT_271278 [Schizophyllum amplum]|uniref:Uncharacterized protein n=1 Tax=Schizophyllum amplum TaxID=97359 RepID=A0A550CF14_9AGAR|nr:hypothetical protein BD626DRAFT_271278 [Auriculariopsis ampla]
MLLRVTIARRVCQVTVRATSRVNVTSAPGQFRLYARPPCRQNERRYFYRCSEDFGLLARVTGNARPHLRSTHSRICAPTIRESARWCIHSLVGGVLTSPFGFTLWERRVVAFQTRRPHTKPWEANSARRQRMLSSHAPDGGRLHRTYLCMATALDPRREHDRVLRWRRYRCCCRIPQTTTPHMTFTSMVGVLVVHSGGLLHRRYATRLRAHVVTALGLSSFKNDINR